MLAGDHLLSSAALAGVGVCPLECLVGCSAVQGRSRLAVLLQWDTFGHPESGPHCSPELSGALLSPFLLPYPGFMYSFWLECTLPRRWAFIGLGC